MANVFIINTHLPSEYSPGRLSRSMVERMADYFNQRGDNVEAHHITDNYDIAEQVRLHQWADVIIVQIPVNWMGVPWTFKKYIDEVYMAGIDGTLCDGDGRSSENPTAGYGTGGKLTDTRYMLSLTYNAPAEAFDNKDDWFMQGRGVDDMFFPVHLNFRFMGLEAAETFTCFDVIKNPNIEADFARLETHLRTQFPA